MIDKIKKHIEEAKAFNAENKEKIDREATNEEVIEFIKGESDAAFDRTFEVLRTRVNLFGVAQPNIQKLDASDRILVELPGVKNKERVERRRGNR